MPLDRGMFPLDKFFPGVVTTAMYKGRLYAVPYSTNAGLLYYRKDLLDAAGLKPPKTWAELREQAQRLSREHGLGGTPASSCRTRGSPSTSWRRCTRPAASCSTRTAPR